MSLLLLEVRKAGLKRLGESGREGLPNVWFTSGFAERYRGGREEEGVYGTLGGEEPTGNRPGWRCHPGRGDQQGRGALSPRPPLPAPCPERPAPSGSLLPGEGGSWRPGWRGSWCHRPLSQICNRRAAGGSGWEGRHSHRDEHGEKARFFPQIFYLNIKLKKHTPANHLAYISHVNIRNKIINSVAVKKKKTNKPNFVHLNRVPWRLRTGYGRQSAHRRCGESTGRTSHTPKHTTQRHDSQPERKPP